MSIIKSNLNGNLLTISHEGKRINFENEEIIDLKKINSNKIYKSAVKSLNTKQNFKILLEEKTNLSVKNEKGELLEETVIVYIKNNNVYYYKSNNNIYNKLVSVPKRLFNIHLSKRSCKFFYLAYINNPFKLKIYDMKFNLDNVNYININLNQYNNNNKINIKKIFSNLHLISFNMTDVLSKEAQINNNPSIALKVNGIDHDYCFSKKNKFIKDTRFYYVPFKTKFIGDFAVHFRRSIKGTVIFVRRKKEEPEYSINFRILESKPVSFLFYFSSRVYKKFKRKNINLFYEKFSSKAEEGAFDIFKFSQKSTTSANYFIINKNCEDYEKIKDVKNVITQYSLKYYWLFYCSDNFIATEVPAHLNILRTNNASFRKEMVKKKNIFLQHGIIYMKNLGKNSTFIKGKDGSCDYIVASSQKECEVICETLNMKENEVLVTGLGIFSKIKHKHINNDSKDIVTIMLTWKPYEEHLEDFSKSSYYKNTIEIYNIVSHYIDKENIKIVAHPKVFDLLNSTDLKSNVWQNPISEALECTKLMITDYSSVCYNSFYRGAAVIFMQPDITLYEGINGKLIPNEDEYVGKRLYKINDLDKLLKNNTKNKKIILDGLRTKEHEEIYKTINEFDDGKNIERIYNKLIELNII